MDFLATPTRRKFLFGCLYLSEGAPIGFIWLALPTRLRDEGVAIEQITWLTAVLVLPWTFKFLWAPLVNLLQTPRWTLRHWIVTAQCLMGATLVPLMWLDPIEHFGLLAGLLVVHALSAATQDVSIDALCISVMDVAERGQYNGWMQAGMLLGRAMMGGGALVLSRHIGPAAVIALLVVITLWSLVLVIFSRIEVRQVVGPRAGEVVRSAARAIRQASTWFGLLFALAGGAAFKSLEVVYGPFLIDRGYEKSEIGWFSAGPMIVSMIVGSIVGGWLADRIGRRRFVAVALLFIVAAILGLAISDVEMNGAGGPHLLVLLAAAAFGIGLFTAASYALFMDITHPAVAATQFSAFMGATNGCESWSSFAVGRIIANQGYPVGMIAMCVASLMSLPLLFGLRPVKDAEPAAIRT